MNTTCTEAWPPWVGHKTEAGGSPPHHNSAPPRHNTRCPCIWGAGPGCICPGHSAPCVSWGQDSIHHVSGPHSLTFEVARPSWRDLCHQEICLDKDQCWGFPGVMVDTELAG